MQHRKAKIKKNNVRTEEWAALEYQCIDSIAAQRKL